MNSNRLLLFFIAFAGLTACSSNSRKFAVVATLTDMPQQTVVMEQINANDMIAIVDSTHSDASGHFELSAVAPEPGLYTIRFPRNKSKYILLSVDKGNIKVEGNWNKIEEARVTGSPQSADLQNFLASLRKHLNDRTTMSIVLDTLKARGNDSMLAVAKADFMDTLLHFTQFVERYADTVSYEPNAVFAARILNLNTEKHYLEAFAQGLNRRFPGTKMTKDYAEWFSRATTKAKKQEQMAGPANGTMAPEVTLPGMDGKTVSLSSFKGKYVLLDFWASWCAPCRGENPNVVAAYEKFKDKNFTVFSVSLDNQKEAWEKAVKDDKLSWTHVSDLKGWASEVVAMYSVHSIPANFLIDPTGKIVAHDLRGSQLDEALTEILMAKP